MKLKLSDPSTESIDQIVEEHLTSNFSDDNRIWEMSQTFASQGYVKLNGLVPDQLIAMLRAETLDLLEQHAKRKDIVIKETGGTKRAMSNVAQKTIAEHGALIPAVYNCAPFREVLGKIARDSLINTPWTEEEYIITRQEKAGDTHGWHWGDYAYTVIWLLECPALEYGGMLQCIPHTKWDKENPRIFEHLVEGAIKTYAHARGDLYFLKSDTTLHRTVPLTADCTRIILNTCWDSGSNPNLEATHETMQDLLG